MHGTDTDMLVATERGLLRAVPDGGGWRVEERWISDCEVTSVAASNGVLLAGTTQGVFRSEDGGRSWRQSANGPDSRHVRWMASPPDLAGVAFAGTEPAGIYVSHDTGRSWRACPEVAALRDKYGWFLPYSPEAGCVRGFAFHGRRGYAAVEVGGVLRSDDAGETWQLAAGSSGEPVFDIPPAPMVFADVHWIASHPSSPEVVLAATAEGVYRSSDGGEAWTVSQAGRYCRGLWVDPEDPDHVVAGPADSVARKNGRIEETRDGGETWRQASDGLDLPWPDRMVERFGKVGNQLLAVSNDGRLYAADPGRLIWTPALADVPGIRSVAASSAG